MGWDFSPPAAPPRLRIAGRREGRQLRRRGRTPAFPAPAGFCNGHRRAAAAPLRAGDAGCARGLLLPRGHGKIAWEGSKKQPKVLLVAENIQTSQLQGMRVPSDLRTSQESQHRESGAQFSQ